MNRRLPKQTTSEIERIGNVLLYDGTGVKADVALRRVGETVQVSDHFTIQNSTDENDGSKDYNRSFDAVKGEWSTYRLTSYKGQDLVANMVLVSPSFVFSQFNEPWARIEDADCNVDTDADIVGDKFVIGDDFNVNCPTGDASLFPHYNEQGQLDAVIVEFEREYELAAGLFNYNISGLRYGDTLGLYDLTADNLETMCDDDDEYVVVDNKTGYVHKMDLWQETADEFIEDFNKGLAEYQEPTGNKFYIIPEEKGFQGNKATHGIYKYVNPETVYHLGYVTNDDAVTFEDYVYEDSNRFMHKWEQKVEVYESDSINDEKDVSDLFPQIATGIAQHVTEFDKEFSQKKQYRMTFENAKGKVKENLINIKKIKTDEQAIEYAEDLIKTWRGDKADSNIKLLKLEATIPNTYRLVDGKAHVCQSELLIDNTTLTSDDLSDLKETELTQ